MLDFDKIDVSEGIDVNNTSALKECDICHYWYFLNKSFKFQPNVDNRCHYLLMISSELSILLFLTLKVLIISVLVELAKINLMQNTDLTKNSRTLKQKFITSYKNGQRNFNFGDIKIEKNKYYLYNKSPALPRDVDIEKVLVANKIFLGENNCKYFIGDLYNDHKVKPLHMLPKTSTYVEKCDGQTKLMYFLIEDDDLLEQYNTIWHKSSAGIKKEFDSKPVHNKEFLKAKIKFDLDGVTDFYDKKIPKVDSNHTCLPIISLDSALKRDENYYLQVFLKEYKYIEKKIIRHNDNLSNFSYSDESDEE